MDRFDEIWKNRFNDSKLPVDDWNSPDDGLVWEEIAAGIAPKKEKKKRLFFWLSIGALITLIVIALLLRKNSFSFIKSTKEKTTQQSQLSMLGNTSSLLNDTYIPTTTKEKSKVVPTSTYTKKRPTTVTTENQMIAKDPNPKPVKQEGSNSIPATKEEKEILNKRTIKVLPAEVPTVNSVELETVEPKESIFSSTQAVGSSASAMTERKEIKTAPQSKNATITTEPIATLLLTPFSVERTETLAKVPSLTTPLAPSTKSMNAFHLAFTSGVIYWKHRISDQYTSDLSAFDFNYTDNYAWQANLQLSYDINSYLSVFSGIQYEQVTSFSGHNSNLTYDVLNEQNASNAYTQNLATPYGLSEANFQLNRQRAVSGNAVDFQVDFESKHIIKNWSMPIGVQLFPLAKKSKWRPSTTVAFGVNYLAGISNTINRIDSNHDAIQYANAGNQAFAKPDINHWHFDLRLGLGLQYEVIPNWQLGINYNWSRGLNPIFELENTNPEQQNYETRIDRHHLSLSIIRLLGN